MYPKYVDYLENINKEITNRICVFQCKYWTAPNIFSDCVKLKSSLILSITMYMSLKPRPGHLLHNKKYPNYAWFV